MRRGDFPENKYGNEQTDKRDDEHQNSPFPFPNNREKSGKKGSDGISRPDNTGNK